MNEKILSPKNNEVFLALFSKPEHNECVLTPFLRRILKLPNLDPNNVQILDPRLHIGREDEKHPIVDVLVKTPDGLIHIEMQYCDYEHMLERIVYYHCRLFGDQLQQGHDYDELERTISLLITDFPLIGEEINYFNRYLYMNPVTHNIFSYISEIDTLELPKIPDIPDGSPEWIWGTYLNGEKEEDFMRLAETYPEVQSAVNVLYELSADEALRMRAEAVEKARRDEAARMKTSLKKGIEIGEQRRRREFAQMMRSDGESEEKIIRYTGYTYKDVDSWTCEQ